jgi:(1->4)-alpha-D-glucan 1-alpha-D-glucosylmutase
VNSLAQTVLRLTSPGVPDLYQGTEFWDFSLVDPDNRRPVDFAARQAALAEGGKPAAMLAHWQDGRVKQAVIARALQWRAAHAELFAKGGYTKLEAEGPAAAHILAFARHLKGKTLVTAVTRLAANVTDGMPLARPEHWAETVLTLPGGNWHDVLNEEAVDGTTLNAADLFARLPVALLSAG